VGSAFNLKHSEIKNFGNYSFWLTTADSMVKADWKINERQRKSKNCLKSVAFRAKTSSKTGEKQRKIEKELYFVAFSGKKATKIEELFEIRCF